MAYTFVDKMLKTGKVSQDVVDLIPRHRVVHAALAIPDDPDDSLDAIYLVEEKIHGRFAEKSSLDCSYASYSMSNISLPIQWFVYLSDFQGAGDLLTDCQVITGSSVGIFSS
ncbi:hypothetical protein F4604DRAFT_1919824 [Suillus subluteus]|nr:hypothetical protein F4604DRAFT_1919824 [Suillus subluteus]